jgi:hypothetical protein
MITSGDYFTQFIQNFDCADYIKAAARVQHQFLGVSRFGSFLFYFNIKDELPMSQLCSNFITVSLILGVRTTEKELHTGPKILKLRSEEKVTERGDVTMAEARGFDS